MVSGWRRGMHSPGKAAPEASGMDARIGKAFQDIISPGGRRWGVKGQRRGPWSAVGGCEPL